MPVATSPSALLPTSPVVKMEDRKRPAINTEEIAPPSKRQQVNGSSKARDNADPTDEAWIEVSKYHDTLSIQTLPHPALLYHHCHYPSLYPQVSSLHTLQFQGGIARLGSPDTQGAVRLLTRSVLMRGLLASACWAARSTNAPQLFAGIPLHSTLNGRYTPPSTPSIFSPNTHADCWVFRATKKMRYTGRCLITKGKRPN